MGAVKEMALQADTAVLDQQVESLAASEHVSKLDKVPLSYMSVEGIEAGALAFKDGALKYGRNSYKTMHDAKWSECIDSLMRHVQAFNNKENTAADSGVSHLGHIIARASMLEYWMRHKIGIDDR